jgi:hypothetical protein
MNGLMNDEAWREVLSLVEVELAAFSFLSWQAIFWRKWDINGPYESGQLCLGA